MQNLKANRRIVKRNQARAIARFESACRSNVSLDSKGRMQITNPGTVAVALGECALARVEFTETGKELVRRLNKCGVG